MVTIDNNKNIQRIIDVIKADPTVYDEGETEGLLREVNFGNPNNDEKKAIKQKPAVYVTTRDSIQTTSYPYGVAISGNANSVTVQYEVTVLAVSKENTEKSQKQIYDLIKNLGNTLEADPLYSDPANPGTDPIFSRSIINELPWDTATRGQVITSITLVLVATIGDTSLVNIPGIGDITLLSDTGGEGRTSINTQNDEGNTKVTKGANVGSRFFEYEYTTTLYESFESLIEADDEHLLTFIYPSGNRAITAKLVFQRDSLRFDGIHTVIVQADKVTV